MPAALSGDCLSVVWRSRNLAWRCKKSRAKVIRQDRGRLARVQAGCSGPPSFALVLLGSQSGMLPGPALAAAATVAAVATYLRQIRIRRQSFGGAIVAQQDRVLFPGDRIVELCGKGREGEPRAVPRQCEVPPRKRMREIGKRPVNSTWLTGAMGGDGSQVVRYYGNCGKGTTPAKPKRKWGN